MRKHYHVLFGMPGYMPDSNLTYLTKKEAQQGAQFIADQFRDDPDGLYRIYGNKRDGYVIERKGTIYALPYLIEIVDCDQPECLQDLED